MRAPVGILSGGCVARAAELPELLSGIPPPQEVVLESYCQVCRSGHSSVIPVSPVFTLGSRALSTGSPVTNSPNFSLLKNVFIFYIFIGNRTFKGQLFFLRPPCPRRLSASAPSAARSLVGLIVAPSELSSPPPPVVVPVPWAPRALLGALPTESFS